MDKKLYVGVIGDQHFKIDSIEECKQMARSIVGELRKKKQMKCLDIIVLLGDLYDTMEKLLIDVHVIAHWFLSELHDIAPLYIIIGNHDRPNNQVMTGPRHFLNNLKKWSNVTIIDDPYAVKIKGYKFIMVPYAPPGKFNELLDGFDLSQVDCIFAHQEVRDAQMGATKSSTGDIWPPIDEKKRESLVDSMSSLSLTDEEKRKEKKEKRKEGDVPLVISGHIHQWQKLDRWLYIGTPRNITYGERAKSTISLFTFSDRLRYPEEERIEIHNKERFQLRLGYKEACQFVPPPDSTGKLKVVGTPQEITTFKVTNAPQLIAAGIKIQYVPRDNLTVSDNKETNIRNDVISKREQYNFTKTFYSNVQQLDPKLFELCEKICGKQNLISLPVSKKSS